ncbi:MAG: hypothetical protein ACLP5V_08290 [Candidatus Bathyarchaeia archaeon]
MGLTRVSSGLIVYEECDSQGGWVSQGDAAGAENTYVHSGTYAFAGVASQPGQGKAGLFQTFNVGSSSGRRIHVWHYSYLLSGGTGTFLVYIFYDALNLVFTNKTLRQCITDVCQAQGCIYRVNPDVFTLDLAEYFGGNPSPAIFTEGYNILSGINSLDINLVSNVVHARANTLTLDQGAAAGGAVITVQSVPVSIREVGLHEAVINDPSIRDKSTAEKRGSAAASAGSKGSSSKAGSGTPGKGTPAKGAV